MSGIRVFLANDNPAYAGVVSFDGMHYQVDARSSSQSRCSTAVFRCGSQAAARR